jgi:hypothetical protein
LQRRRHRDFDSQNRARPEACESKQNSEANLQSQPEESSRWGFH